MDECFMATKSQLKITPRYTGDRGTTHLPWLHSRHTFSFGNYLDPDHVGFRSLRVINEDRLAPGKGVPEQNHYFMEILLVVTSGILKYEDNLGRDEQLDAGDLQLVSTGRGVSHRESNPSEDSPTHYLEIWIQSDDSVGEPRSVEIELEAHRVTNGLALLASAEGQSRSALIRQDAEVFFGDLSEGNTFEVPYAEAYPYAWIQVLSGEVEIEDTTLADGDGASIEASEFPITATENAEFLLIRLP
ncbi:MAG: pirin family protein [Verrucomicrobiota bacterium]